MEQYVLVMKGQRKGCLAEQIKERSLPRRRPGKDQTRVEREEQHVCIPDVAGPSNSQQSKSSLDLVQSRSYEVFAPGSTRE